MSEHLRVMAGRFRGRRLRAPKGHGTRPASGRMRLSLMNLLGEDVLAGARVLDLFAGTGATGIEALSRGAASAVFVERARPALECLRGNLATLDLPREDARVLAMDALTFLRGEVPAGFGPFDLVFCDPPYPLYDDPAAVGRLREGLAHLAAGGAVAPGGFLSLEHPARRDPGPDPAGWRPIDRRAYSAAGVSLYRLRTPEDMGDGTPPLRSSDA